MAKAHNDLDREFLAMYDELADPLFRHCFYKISDREKALDLVQETFARMWEYLSSGKKVEHLKSFIYRIANNMIIDEYRKKKSQSLDVLAEDGFDPEEESAVSAIVTSSEAKIAVSGIQRLPEPYRQIMELRYIDGLSITEIAGVIRESENTVSVRITRATQKLRDILKTHHGA